MCIINKLDKNYLRIMLTSIILVISITHIVFGFLIKVNNFNSLDIFDSSPLFNFTISNDCQGKSSIVFHRWGGRKEWDWSIDDDFNIEIETKIVDETDITKINGNYFCYKHISYKDLLYNGQIIKKGEECPLEYTKICGRIDTLEQELCIKETENCPLYDIGLGSEPDQDNYIYDAESNVYYNKESYNESNKKIIGKLVLNDGQPCYNSTEKLWKKFASKEAVETHLKCEYEVFGNYSDERYEQKGNITYLRLYKDNLNSESQNFVIDKIKGDEVVYLYKREFFGIDKECDEKYNLNQDAFSILSSNEQMERNLLLVEGFIIAIHTLTIFLLEIIFCGCLENYLRIPQCVLCIFYSIYIGFLISSIICQSVFLFRMIQNDVSDYNCSDSITNEIIRKETEFTKRNIIYTKINLFIDSIFLLGNCLAMIIGLILERFDKSNSSSKNESSDFKNYNTDNTEIPYYEYPKNSS